MTSGDAWGALADGTLYLSRWFSSRLDIGRC